MAEFITIMVYCVLGTALMLFGTFVVDLVIPCEFPAEIKKGNVAVGSVMAGISVGIGIIIRAAVMSPSGTAVHESLLTGIASNHILLCGRAGVLRSGLPGAEPD
ncbi:MAG: DUF350 domain-containing protein [Enterocloster bolteae]